MRVGLLLRAWRKLHDLTIKQLSDEIGITPNVLSGLERGADVEFESVWAVMEWLFTHSVSMNGHKEDVASTTGQ